MFYNCLIEIKQKYCNVDCLVKKNQNVHLIQNGEAIVAAYFIPNRNPPPTHLQVTGFLKARSKSFQNLSDIETKLNTKRIKFSCSIKSNCLEILSVGHSVGWRWFLLAVNVGRIIKLASGRLGRKIREYSSTKFIQ